MNTSSIYTSQQHAVVLCGYTFSNYSSTITIMEPTSATKVAISSFNYNGMPTYAFFYQGNCYVWIDSIVFN